MCGCYLKVSTVPSAIQPDGKWTIVTGRKLVVSASRKGSPGVARLHQREGGPILLSL
jgi:hypothetical protein